MTKETFSDRVYTVVSRIPKGKVSMYKDIAMFAGSPGASRAVGSLMKKNIDRKKIPCHRVVGSDGRMHGYAYCAGESSKVKLLKKEGVSFSGNSVNLEQHRWKG